MTFDIEKLVCKHNRMGGCEACAHELSERRRQERRDAFLARYSAEPVAAVVELFDRIEQLDGSVAKLDRENSLHRVLR